MSEQQLKLIERAKAKYGAIYPWWTGSAVSPIAGNCPKQSNLPGSEGREYDVLGRLLQPGMITHNSISLIPLNKTGRSPGSLIIRK